MKKADLKESKPIRVDANGKPVMLVLIEGKVYAIDPVCSHREGPLEQGLLEGYNIKCPWHGAIYDVRTGKGHEETPWGPGQASYKVDVSASGEITVDV